MRLNQRAESVLGRLVACLSKLSFTHRLQTIDTNRAIGEELRAAMVIGQARKNKRPLSMTVDTSPSEKENSTPECTPSGTPAPSTSTKRRREDGVNRLVGLVEEQGRIQTEILEEQRRVNESIILEHCRANEESRLSREESRLTREEYKLAREAQERTSAALLDILRAGLLNG